MSSASPELLARGVLIQGSRLLVCRSLKGGYVYLPGGHVEPFELAADALAREFLEETGMVIRVGACLLVAEVLAPQARIHELNLVFLVEQAGREPIRSRETDIAFEWVELASLPQLDLRPRAIRAWLAGGGVGQDGTAAIVSDLET
jgi:8-oxo-dGTP pyrophosphatase MutT (NUDIX family)